VFGIIAADANSQSQRGHPTELLLQHKMATDGTFSCVRI